MKRAALTLLALAIVLTACGAPASESSAEATPAPTVYPASGRDLLVQPTEYTLPPDGTPQPVRPQDDPLLDGFELPDPGFEPESYWVSEPYGVQGQALLLMRSLDGGAQFRCWHSCYTLHGNGIVERDLSTQTFAAKAGGDGVFDIFIDRDDNLCLSVNGDKLTITYPEEEIYADYPENFYRCGYEDARAAWRNMPYNSEARIPLPATSSQEEILSMPGVVQTGEDSYRLGDLSFVYRENHALEYVSVTGPGTGFSVRGLDVGSSAADLLASFPSGIADFDPATDGWTVLYGTDGFNSSRAEFIPGYEGQRCFYLLDNAYSHVFFYVNEEGTIERIVYSRFL